MSNELNRNTESLEKRRERATKNRLSQNRGPLFIPEDQKDKDFIYRVAADRNNGSRVQQLLDLGYEFVSQDDMKIGDQESKTPNTLGKHVHRPLGGGVDGILMRIPKELYADALKIKEKEVQSMDAAMLKPNGLLPATLQKTKDT